MISKIDILAKKLKGVNYNLCDVVKTYATKIVEKKENNSERLNMLNLWKDRDKTPIKWFKMKEYDFKVAIKEAELEYLQAGLEIAKYTQRTTIKVRRLLKKCDARQSTDASNRVWLYVDNGGEGFECIGCEKIEQIAVTEYLEESLS